MEQTERIRLMEERLTRATQAVRQLNTALDLYDHAQDDISHLDAYYGSHEWLQDMDDDRAGLLPSDLQRGVLSEDAIWNLLAEWREIKGRLRLLQTNK